MAQLSEIEISLVLKRFPKFELSYETMTHKKVHNSDVILAIPEGIKFFSWFTNYNNNDLCFILEINDNNKIKDIKTITTGFSNDLALGTIFYGTMFNYNSITCFCIEDIYYYKGRNYIHTQYSLKLQLLKEILSNDMSQSALNKDFTVFGAPLMSNDFNIILKDIQSLPYKVSHLKFRFFEKNSSRKILTMKYYKPGVTNKDNNNKSHDNVRNAVFNVMADIDPDIYNLFVYKNGIEEYYDTALVSDYKTSVMMNKLFRNIKENINLDAIEESDDEEEFEDSREDKFVYLDKSIKMICEFNYKFKRWCPVRLAKENDKLFSLSMLSNKQ